jgi:PAS domain S-box-containing protein
MLRHRARLTLAAVVLVALCAAMVVVDTIRTVQERQTALAAARTQVAGLAYSLAEQAEGVVLAADAILVGLRERIETDGTGPAALGRLQRVAAARALTIKTLYGFYAYDSQGRWLINPGGSGTPPYSVADRAYFIHHRDDRSRDLWIGVPLVSRSSGRWVFTLSLRVDRPDGSFGGVVAAAIDIERMQTFYGSLGLGPHGIVALFRGDGQLLLRHPLIESRLGGRVPNQLLMSQLAGQGGDIEWASQYDGVRRLIGYRRLDSFPMVVLAGLGRDEALAGWRRDAISHLLGALTAAGAGVTVGLALLLRESRRQHAAELAAAAADSEYRMLADNATDMILRVQEGGRRIYASPASWTLLGYSPQQMLLRRAADDIHPDDLPQAAPAEWADPGRAGEGTTASYRMRRADGGYVWVEATLRRLPGEPGRLPETLVVVRDITARQQVAGRLLEANRLLRRAEALAGIGHWRVEPASGAVFWSEGMVRIYGWPDDHLLTLESAIAGYHPDDRPEIRAKLQHTIDTGAPLQFECRLIRPDGATRQVTARGEPKAARWRRDCGIARNWTRSGNSQPASRTTSTTCCRACSAAWS